MNPCETYATCAAVQNFGADGPALVIATVIFVYLRLIEVERVQAWLALWGWKK